MRLANPLPRRRGAPELPDNADRSVAKQKFKITNWPTYNKAL
ncbi:hypothetical protein, partial [Klebsiella pneumoniae]